MSTPDLTGFVGARRAKRLEGRLSEAATAFANERHTDARRILAPIVSEIPDLSEARELYGLALYRLGRWKEAAAQLEAFVDLTNGSTEQHPVLEDCHRALRHYSRVDELWRELREASPDASIVAEGRIVAAGALADQGRLADAIRMLAKAVKLPKRPREHNLRQAYALADLYERAGDLPQARSLFGAVAQSSPGFLDAAERATALD